MANKSKRMKWDDERVGKVVFDKQCGMSRTTLCQVHNLSVKQLDYILYTRSKTLKKPPQDYALGAFNNKQDKHLSGSEPPSKRKWWHSILKLLGLKSG